MRRYPEGGGSTQSEKRGGEWEAGLWEVGIGKRGGSDWNIKGIKELMEKNHLNT